MSNKQERTSKVYGKAGGQKQTGNQPGRWQCRAGGGDLVTVRLAAPDERPCRPLVRRGRDLGGHPEGCSGPTADRGVPSSGMIGR
jgi:hypothetical protein